MTSHDIYLVSLKLLTFLFIWGRWIHNGLILLSTLYQMKNLLPVSWYFFYMQTHVYFHICWYYWVIDVLITYNYWIFGRMKLSPSSYSFLRNNNFLMSQVTPFSLHKKWSFPLRVSSVNVTTFTATYNWLHKVIKTNDLYKRDFFCFWSLLHVFVHLLFHIFCLFFSFFFFFFKLSIFSSLRSACFILFTA